MKINVIASGSNGNFYTVDDGTNTLLLEAGISPGRMSKAFARCENVISGALVTHEHKDHCNLSGIEFLRKRGVTVCMSSGTLNEQKINGYNIKLAKSAYIMKLGAFSVLPFEVEHDAAEPLGYYIKSDITDESLVFATDMSAIYGTFRQIDYLMLECNYIDELLGANERAGKIDARLARRIRDTHYSLNDVRDFIHANADALKYCKQIYLIHLSKRNCVGSYAEKSVEQLTGIPTKAFCL